MSDSMIVAVNEASAITTASANNIVVENPSQSGQQTSSVSVNPHQQHQNQKNKKRQGQHEAGTRNGEHPSESPQLNRQAQAGSLNRPHQGGRQFHRREQQPRGGGGQQSRDQQQQRFEGQNTQIVEEQQRQRWNNRRDQQQGQYPPPRLNNINNVFRNYRSGGGVPQPRNQHHQWRGKAGVGPSRIAKERIDHAGVRMTGEISDCLICCQRSDLFALGECMHPICMECALRIRMVGESKQCPQCRTEIPLLYFVSAPPGQQLHLRLPTQTVSKPQLERKFDIRFESQYAVDCFTAYMANQCKECAKKGDQHTDFGTFAELRAHMSQAHQLSFCHICCDNLNVLTKDRRVYTREELQQHMNGKLAREEDGFRGHPMCQFCEQRFYDDEQQYRHLRKEHYFCQFCDQDGREQNVFYRNQHQLSQHNRRMHHPCLDHDCLQMGICFRTDVELDVHKARQHHRLAQSAGGGGGRGSAIPLDIQFSTNRGGIAASSRQPQVETDENSAEANQQMFQQRSSQVVRIVPSAQSQQQSVRIVPSTFANPIQSASDFPGLPAVAPPPPLYGAPPGWTGPPPVHAAQSNKQSVGGQQAAPKSRPLPLQSSEQFPTLGGTKTTTTVGSSTVLSQQQQNSIWGQKSTKELFAQKPGEPAKKETQEKRPKFVAAPEVWPEHMLEKLKAREQGLADPEPIQAPHWLNPPKKEKKKKSKTVPISAVSNRHAEAIGLVPSSSKFNTLAAYDEANEESSVKKNEWSSAVKTAPTKQRLQMKLMPSSDDSEFVRIQLPGDEQRVKMSEANFSIGPPPGFENSSSGKSTDKGVEVEQEGSPSSSHQSIEQKPNIVHLTMRSIASSLFGGGGGTKEDQKSEEDK